MSTLHELIYRVVLSGSSDWVDAAEVASHAQEFCGADGPDAEREMSWLAIEHVLKEGLMEIGDVDYSGFTSWGLSVEDAMKRVQADWLALGRRPSIWEVCLLQNTPKGNAAAERWYKERHGQ